MKTLTDTRKSVSHRLAIIEGHLKKVRKMVEEGAYCIDTIHQSQAIQHALRKFDEHLLEQHLRICVARDIASGNAEKITKELTAVLRHA